MVKIVVPSHYSRYIVTASDLESYLRTNFGEGHDFQIEVLLNLLHCTVVNHWLTTNDSIPTTCGILKAQGNSQMFVADTPALIILSSLITDAHCSQKQLM